jgi:DNA-directed RNA polymerase specialized sigma24 family protein
MSAYGTKRVLTPESFGKFLRWLSPDDELAIREYQSIRRRLVRYFVHKGCPDPDELFDQTVDIMVGKINSILERPASPLAYCYGVAKNVWRQKMREYKPTILDADPVSPEPSDSIMYEHELQCLDRCVDQLSASDRDVITRYHHGEGREKIESRRVLADSIGGMNALRIRVCRIRKDLRICVTTCVKRSLI